MIPLLGAGFGVASDAALLAAGDLTPVLSARHNRTVHKFAWTNAMIVALGAALTGDLTICTIPAKCIVANVWVRLLTQASVPATLTLAIGRTGALYVDYIGAADALAAPDTVYGDAAAERGANLIGFEIPSLSAGVALKMHLIATVANLSAVLGSTGEVYVETVQLP